MYLTDKEIDLIVEYSDKEISNPEEARKVAQELGKSLIENGERLIKLGKTYLNKVK